MDMKAPQFIETPRLVLRRPVASDAQAIFERYASDPHVTRYVAWPRHKTLQDTMAFIEFSDNAWHSSPGGPYVIEMAGMGMVVGGAGFAFEGPQSASVGYALAKDLWGHGYATEVLQALIGVARRMGIRRLCACCHADNGATIRVLEKCGLVREAECKSQAAFPNLASQGPVDLLQYARTL